MRILVSVIVSFLCFLPVHPCISQSAAPDILVDNAPIIQPDPLVVARVTGIRSMSGLELASDHDLANAKISETVIVQSALSIPEVAESIEQLQYNVSTLTIEQIEHAIDVSNYKSKYLSHSGELQIGARKFAPVTSDITDDPKIRFWNPETIINLLATKVIDTGNVDRASSDSGLDVRVLEVDDKYKATIEEIYSSLLKIKASDVQAVPVHLANVKEQVRNYNELEMALLRDIGEITFGWPVVYKADEMHLELPESIAKRFDVYWIELSVTYRELSAGDLTELAINFALPNDYLALELAPRFFGIPVEQHEELKSPELGLDLGGTGISVGEFFRRTVSFTYLKPVIESFGLREARFSWTLRENAVRSGSHRFVVVVGAPKGKSGTDLAMSAHVRTKPFYGFGGDIAGTDVITKWVNF